MFISKSGFISYSIWFGCGNGKTGRCSNHTFSYLLNLNMSTCSLQWIKIILNLCYNIKTYFYDSALDQWFSQLQWVSSIQNWDAMVYSLCWWVDRSIINHYLQSVKTRVNKVFHYIFLSELILPLRLYMTGFKERATKSIPLMFCIMYLAFPVAFPEAENFFKD